MERAFLAFKRRSAGLYCDRAAAWITFINGVHILVAVDIIDRKVFDKNRKLTVGNSFLGNSKQTCLAVGCKGLCAVFLTIEEHIPLIGQFAVLGDVIDSTYLPIVDFLNYVICHLWRLT